MNHLVSYSGVRFDGKLVDGVPTCITISGQFVVRADSQPAAFDAVTARVTASHDCEIKITDLRASVPLGGQKMIDARANRGGTKSCPLVIA
jgi:hypothetical protein